MRQVYLTDSRKTTFYQNLVVNDRTQRPGNKHSTLYYSNQGMKIIICILYNSFTLKLFQLFYILKYLL